MKTISVIFSGRLGNNAFQLAAGLSMAKLSGRTYVRRKIMEILLKTVLEMYVMKNQKKTLGDFEFFLLKT